MSAIISKKIDSTLVLELNRPKVINALNRELLKELHENLLKPPGSIKALILTGSSGKGFSAGADLKELAKMDVSEVKSYLELAIEALKTLERYPRPTVAMLHGYVLGGGLELALACDFLIAEEKAILGLPETKLGLIPGFEGEKRLKRRVGATKAKEMIFTGKQIGAKEALSIKLVDAVAKSEYMEQMLNLHLNTLQPNLKYAKEAFTAENTIPLFIEAFKNWKK